MTAPALGTNAYVGMGKESSWGSVVSRTKFLEVNEESLDRVESDIASPSLYRAGLHKNRIVQGPISAGGGIIFNPQYEGMEMLLEAALGTTAVSSRPDITNAGSVYDWTFALADANSKSLTLEVHRDIKSWAFHGSIVNSLQFTFGGPGDALVVAADFICEDGEYIATVTPPTFSTSPLITGAHAILTWGGGALDVENAQIVLSNNFDDGRRFIGSRYISQPYRSGKIAVTGRFTTEFQSVAQYDDFIAATRRALRIVATHPTAIIGSYYYKLQIDVAVARLTAVSPKIGSGGRVRVDIPFISYRDDSNQEIVVSTRGTVSSV